MIDDLIELWLDAFQLAELTRQVEVRFTPRWICSSHMWGLHSHGLA